MSELKLVIALVNRRIENLRLRKMIAHKEGNTKIVDMEANAERELQELLRELKS